MNTLNLKIKWLWWRIEISNKLHRFLYCRRNYHKLKTCHTTLTNSEGLSLETKYIKCINCESCFFVTDEHKKNYQRINQSAYEQVKQMIDFDPVKDNKERSKLMSGNMKVEEFKVR